MRKIKGILVLSIMLMTFLANAQFKFGVGGGVNFANFSGSDVSGAEGLLGYNGGVMMEVKLPVKIGVEADLLYSSKGASYDGLGASLTANLSYVDLPVVLKLYSIKVLSIQLGAQYSMLINGKMAGIDIKDELNASDISAVFGFGLDVLKIHASARYNYGLTSIYKNGADVKNNMLTLSLGFWLKK